MPVLVVKVAGANSWSSTWAVAPVPAASAAIMIRVFAFMTAFFPTRGPGSCDPGVCCPRAGVTPHYPPSKPFTLRIACAPLRISWLGAATRSCPATTAQGFASAANSTFCASAWSAAMAFTRSMIF